MQYLFYGMSSLRLKIGSGYLILVLIILATSTFALLKFIQIQDTVAPILRATYQSTRIAENLLKSLEDQEHAVFSAVVEDPELYQGIYRAYFIENRDIFIYWLVLLKEAELTPQQAALKDSIISIDSLYNQRVDVFFTLLSQPRKRDLAHRYQKYVLRPIAEQLRNQCAQLLEANQGEMVKAEARIQRTTQEAIISMVITTLLSIILAITTSIRFTRSVIKPAEKLTHIVRRIGQGNLNQKIDVFTDDEIGLLSSEFNKMTERLRRYEEMNIHKLLAEKKKTETIVGSIAEPVVVTDTQGLLVLVNEAAMNLFSLTRNWEGRPIRDVVNDPKILPMIEKAMTQSNEQERREVLVTLKRNDIETYYRPHQTNINDTDGNPLFTVTIFHDVTRFKTLERMKSDFIATVSHELRTPLTSLAMGIDILIKELSGPLTAQQRELLTAAKDDIERLRKLVKDLLDLSKLESNQYELRKESVQFSQILENASRAVRLQFKEKNIEFQIAVPPTLPLLYADGEKITWVLTNLLNNALRYTEAGGRVTVTANVHNNHLLVSVSDTGEGIPEEYQEIIFDKFVQVKPSTATTPGSVGLGLAIAREIIENHKGSIWVESTVGVGSTFYFTLPLNG